jgi:HEPN domain-containing protein
MGISNDAREFLDAAHLVRRDKPAWFAPTYFLVCQSIELSLKAFLRGSGYSDKQLRRLSHNLDACIQAAHAGGLDSHVRLSEAVAAVSLINAYYYSKDLQYSRSGYKSYPQAESLLALAERLWESLRTFSEEHRDYHVGKDTAIA